MSSGQPMDRHMLGQWPIAKKLTAMLVLVSGLVLLLTAAAFVGYEYWSFRRSARDHLAVRSQIMAANLTASLAFDNDADAREILSSLRADPQVVAAAVFGGDDLLFATYPPGLPDSALPATPGRDGYRFEGGMLIGWVPVAEEAGTRLGTLYLALDLTALRDTLRLSGLIGLAVFGIALMAAYLISRVLQRTISQPILTLAETAASVSSRHDYSVRAPALHGNELGELTSALNHMLSRIEEQDHALRESRRAVEGYAADLEQRVAERTEELEESNEALRRYAADLKAANLELDAFAYSVSHDLRAPLRSVDGFSHMLLEDYGAVLDETAQDALNRVRAASQRMGSLIDDLLRLARISRVEMHTEPVDLSCLAEDIMRDLRSTAPERSVEFTAARGLSAQGDRRLLQVAMENLLRNSWKYTSKKSRPSIEFGSVQVNGERAFMVRDNGAGFDMRYANKLFGEFQRLHTDAEFEGSGVGLATVRRIVARHGGRIWAEGVVDRGATFYFTLHAHPVDSEVLA